MLLWVCQSTVIAGVRAGNYSFVGFIYGLARKLSGLYSVVMCENKLKLLLLQQWHERKKFMKARQQEQNHTPCTVVERGPYNFSRGAL